MLSQDKRVRIITGHYGSGKTEFAVNYAIRLRELTDEKIAIADMDVVNPYFRSREKKIELEEKDILVIGSSIEGSALDLPAVSAQVMTPMEDKSYQYIIDVGGDSVGSRALGRFTYLLDDDEYDMLMVVNANREQTSDVQGVLRHKMAIEATTKLKVTGFINNTHLVRETTIEDIKKGDALLKEVSRETGIAVRYVSAMRHLIGEITDDLSGEIFPLDLMMRENWM